MWQQRNWDHYWSPVAKNKLYEFLYIAAAYTVPEVLAIVLFIVPWLRNLLETSSWKIFHLLTWWFQVQYLHSVSSWFKYSGSLRCIITSRKSAFMTILCHFECVIPNTSCQLGRVILNIHVTLNRFSITLNISCHFGQCHKRSCFLLVYLLL